MSQQEQQPEESGAIVTTVPATKTRRALSGLKRELTDEELAAPGTQKMILEELERLSDENSRLSSFKDDYHRADKNLAVVEEKQKRNIAAEIVSGSCLAVGAAALGYAPAVWASPPSGVIALVFGAVLIICGIIAKAIKL
ncbi:hypothetical protein [Metallibacterium scheffleri]|uniref:hypothetical protein n=1 Tax=Metallibacterium scheffleri TaxID=993689 RepID=UPI0010A02344|nr:hypothetical protein [Metallibacterium scheffleri]